VSTPPGPGKRGGSGPCSFTVVAATEQAGTLRAGQLGTVDLTVSTVANVGPGIDFYFVFGVVVVTAGVAAPLTILAAGLAVVLLATTVAEFTRAEPSAGSFIVVYLLTNISLPVFIWRRHRAMFSPLRHVVVPILGSAVLVVPFIELCQPGQPSPYGLFPYVALGLVAVAVAVGRVVVHRHPLAGSDERAPTSPST
jgi:amino acid transporter